jgi:putative endonuclease
MDKLPLDTRKQIGAAGEEVAAGYLHELGYRILLRNWRCSRGEIDIIAELEDRLIFVEVRSRSIHGKYGTAKESVDARKQQQVRETAQYYLHRYRQYDRKLRFDVITVEFEGEGQNPVLEHTIGAF